MATVLFGGLSGRRLTCLVGENVFRWAGQSVVPNWVWGKLVRISVVGLQPNELDSLPKRRSRFRQESSPFGSTVLCEIRNLSPAQQFVVVRLCSVHQSMYG
jgi:hypothetical protein